MSPAAILDTGPLVAFLDRRDRKHAWAMEALSRVRAPVATCEAVLSEACFLLRGLRGGPEAVTGLVERGFLVTPLRIERKAAAVGRLLERYASVPMSFADACLVRLSELLPDAVLITLDNDFRIYRRHGRQAIPVSPMPD